MHVKRLFYNIVETAYITGIQQVRLRARCRRNEFPHARQGKDPVFFKADILVYLRRLLESRKGWPATWGPPPALDSDQIEIPDPGFLDDCSSSLHRGQISRRQKKVQDVESRGQHGDHQ